MIYTGKVVVTFINVSCLRFQCLNGFVYRSISLLIDNDTAIKNAPNLISMPSCQELAHAKFLVMLSNVSLSLSLVNVTRYLTFL